MFSYCSTFLSVLGSVGGVSDNEIMGSTRRGNYGMSRGSTPTEYSIDWSCVWLDWLISAITAQLDWPDILVSFVRRITHSMKAPRRQLLLQQSFSILGQQRSGEPPSTVKTVGTLTQPFVKSVPLCCGSFSVNVQGGEKAFRAAAEDFALSLSSSPDTAAFFWVSSVICLCYF